MFRKLAWQLTASYIVVVLCSMGILGFYMLSELESSLQIQLQTSVRHQSMLLAGAWATYLEEGPVTEAARRHLWQLSQRLAWQNGSRLRVVGSDGQIVVEAGEGGALNRNEQGAIQAAFAGRDQRLSEPDPLDPGLLEVSLAYPVFVRRPPGPGETGDQESVEAVVFVSTPSTYIRRTLHSLLKLFLLGTFVSLVISSLLSLFVSYYITQPLRSISHAADRLARGDLDIQVPTSRMNEVGELGMRFNYMARQLNASTDLVLEEKNKLAAVLANMADGVLMMDLKGNVLVMNPSAVEMLRRDPAPVEGSEREAAERGWRLAVSEMPAAERVLREGLVRAVQASEEVREEISLAAGRVARVIYSPISSEQGELAGYVVILHDITELRRLSELKSEFVSDVSHELKTPLASIKGLAEVLLDGALEEAEGVRFLASIGREVDRMTRLVRDLLSLSKIESGVVKMDVRDFDLGALVGEAVENILPRAQNQRVALEVRIAGGEASHLAGEGGGSVGPRRIFATGDADRVEQVVVNLLDNALRYSPSDSTIRVDVRTVDMMCRVDVTDQGIGIPEDDLERIFARFYRVDKARTREKGGTGLGLSIARQIVERLGGRIWARSDGEGKGSRFSFTLPRPEGRRAFREAGPGHSVSAENP